MGDEIIIENIEIIQGGVIQIDFYNKDKNKHDRAFCDPEEFWGFIGKSMQKNMNDWAKKFDEKYEGGKS